MYLEIAELGPFLVLAEELHFRKAAERLFLSQPALTKLIQRMEHKIGGALFLRTRRKVTLSETGRVLIPLAQKLLIDSKTAFESAREAADGRAGSLRIGFGISSLPEILPRAIRRFRRAYPHVELQMQDMATPLQITGLLHGNIDIGIVRVPVPDPRVQCFPLFRERLVAVTPRGFRFHQGLSSLRDRPFISLRRATSETFHQHVLAVCRRAGFTPRVVQEANEIFTILNLVRAGIGSSLVPSSAVRMRVPGVHFHELRMREAEWQVGVAWKKSSEKRELIARFSAAVARSAAKT